METNNNIKAILTKTKTTIKNEDGKIISQITSEILRKNNIIVKDEKYGNIIDYVYRYNYNNEKKLIASTSRNIDYDNDESIYTTYYDDLERVIKEERVLSNDYDNVINDSDKIILDSTKYKYFGDTDKVYKKISKDNFLITESEYDIDEHLIKEEETTISSGTKCETYYAKYDSNGNIIKEYDGEYFTTMNIEYDENNNAIKSVKNIYDGRNSKSKRIATMTLIKKYDNNGKCYAIIHRDINNDYIIKKFDEKERCTMLKVFDNGCFKDIDYKYEDFNNGSYSQTIISKEYNIFDNNVDITKSNQIFDKNDNMIQHTDSDGLIINTSYNNDNEIIHRVVSKRKNDNTIIVMIRDDEYSDKIYKMKSTHYNKDGKITIINESIKNETNPNEIIETRTKTIFDTNNTTLDANNDED